MKRTFLDLYLIAILVILGAGMAVTNSPLAWARVPLGILLTLALPGYTLLAALFPEPAFAWIERLALSVGLSLSIAVTGGLVMFWLTREMSTQHWAFFLGAITLIACGVAAVRRKNLYDTEALFETDYKYEDEQQSKPLVPATGRLAFSIGRLQPLLISALALVTLLGALRYAQAEARVLPKTDIVQVALTPDPTNPVNRVRIAVMAKTAEPQFFTVVLKQGNQTIKEWTNIQIQSDGRWETSLAWDGPILSRSSPIEAYLYDTADPGVIYRQVSLWPQ